MYAVLGSLQDVVMSKCNGTGLVPFTDWMKTLSCTVKDGDTEHYIGGVAKNGSVLWNEDGLKALGWDQKLLEMQMKK